KEATIDDIVCGLTGSDDDSKTRFPALSWLIGERKFVDFENDRRRSQNLGILDFRLLREWVIFHVLILMVMRKKADRPEVHPSSALSNISRLPYDIYESMFDPLVVMCYDGLHI
ncbi:hypothetical protein Tco_1159047, partial [Tanacetum coccineum]